MMRTNELYDLDDSDMKLLLSGGSVFRGQGSALSDAGPSHFLCVCYVEKRKKCRSAKPDRSDHQYSKLFQVI